MMEGRGGGWWRVEGWRGGRVEEEAGGKAELIGR